MEDDDDQQRSNLIARRRGSSGGDWPDGVCYLLMDQILDKLKLLDYESSFCAVKSFPIFDHSLFLVPGKNSPFPCFAAVVSWALKLCKADFLDWEFDDPSTSSNNILLEVTKMGFTADFPASKLKSGYGIHVLTLLKFVIDRALRTKGIRIRKPSYDHLIVEQTGSNLGNAGNDIDEDFCVGGGIDDTDRDGSKIGDSDDDDDIQYDALYASEPTQDAEADGELQPALIMQSSVDPAEWKLELERVAPLLKTKMMGAGKEWRTHLDTMVKHEQLLREIMPDLNTQLNKIGTQMAEIAARIQSQERHIQEKFSHLVGEFQGEHLAIEEMKQNYSRLSNEVSRLSESLASKTDELDSMKRQLDSRNDSMTDMSPLRRIRTAMVELRSEIRMMELHIGVLRHQMLQARA